MMDNAAALSTLEKQKIARFIADLARTEDLSGPLKRTAIKFLISLQNSPIKEDQLIGLAVSSLLLVNSVGALVMAHEGMIPSAVRLLSSSIEGAREGVPNELGGRAANVLGLILEESDSKVRGAARAAIKPLIAMLQLGTENETAEAARALQWLALDPTASEEMIKYSIEQHLQPMLETKSSSKAKDAAAWIFCNLAMHDPRTMGVPWTTIISSLAESLLFLREARSAAYVFAGFAASAPLCADIARSYTVHCLVTVMMHLAPIGRRAAAWALSEITLHNLAEGESVIDHAIPALVEMLESKDLSDCIPALLVMSNLAPEAKHCRALVQKGAIRPLAILTLDQDVAELAAYILCCMSEDELHCHELVAEGAHECLMDLLCSPIPRLQQARAAAAHALSNLVPVQSTMSAKEQMRILEPLRAMQRSSNQSERESASLLLNACNLQHLNTDILGAMKVTTASVDKIDI